MRDNVFTAFYPSHPSSPLSLPSAVLLRLLYQDQQQKQQQIIIIIIISTAIATTATATATIIMMIKIIGKRISHRHPRTKYIDNKLKCCRLDTVQRCLFKKKHHNNKATMAK